MAVPLYSAEDIVRVFNRRVVALVATLLGFSMAVVDPAAADGTEKLGPASIPISTGNGTAAAGVGLADAQPGTMKVTVPSGAAVKQVLLYWEGQHDADGGADDSATVNGKAVTAKRIGGPAYFFTVDGGRRIMASAYRADITSLGLVKPGTSSLSVGGLAFSYRNNGAGVFVIYDTGGAPATIAVRDGVDLAYIGFPEPRKSTVPQTFSFAATGAPRVAELTLFGASVKDDRPRPSAVDITVAGATKRHWNLFGSTSGPEWDTIVLPVDVPAGASKITVKVLSISDGSSNQPASLDWLAAGLAVEGGPVGATAGCTSTQGYWKTHSRFGPAPYDSTWSKLAHGEDTMFFDTGKTWYQALTTQPRGNAYWILSKQYVAAMLNQLAGADVTAIAGQLEHARQLLETYDGSPQPMSKITGAVRDDFVATASALDAYNNGRTGPGGCG